VYYPLAFKSPADNLRWRYRRQEGGRDV